jgi:hypothetical protein
MPAEAMIASRTIAAPLAVVRLGGLPVSVLTRLRFTGTASRIDRLLSDQCWLTAEGTELAELMYGLIGEAGGSPVKPRLVGLRRALHAMRPPAPAEWDASVREVLPPGLRDRVGAWLARRQRWRRDRADLASVLRQESREKEEVLRQVAADPGFRRALWLSSQPLAGELEKWLDDPARRPRRQSIARLAKYLTRAATKTSPYSAFAVTGRAAWSGTGPAVRVGAELAPRGVFELSEYLLSGLVGALVRHPRLAGSVRVRRNPSVLDQDGQLSFLGRPPAEPVLTLPVTAAVRACLDALAAQPQVSLAELLAHLAASAGAEAPAVAEFVSHLVEIGLLEIRPPVPGDPPSVAELASWVGADGGDQLAEVAGGLRRLSRDLGEPVPLVDVAGFRSRQESLTDTVAALADRLDASVGKRARTPVAYDSVVCRGESVRCGTAAWQPALTDLHQVGRWLAVFDSALPLRLALRELWGEWFEPGGRVPLLALHRAVQEAATGSGARAEELRGLLSGNPVGGAVRSAFASIRELGRLQAQALAPLRGAGRESAGEVRVDPAALAELASTWPAWIGPLRSLGCYVQPVPAAGGLGLVLTTTNTGYGQGRSRLAYLLSLAGAEPAAGDVAGEPDGPRLAELAGAHGSNLNHRAASVPYEIDYPFTRSGRAAPHRLPLRDLMVDVDPHRDLLRLHSTRLGAEVRGLALGLLTIAALPPAARLLVLAFGDRPMAPVAVRRARRFRPEEREVRAYPRVSAGRVVLHRAAWSGGAAAVPRRESGEDDASYLLRLAGWRRAAGIPRRCFVRALRAGGEWTDARRPEKARKPVYLDFDNWFLVLGFENVLRSRDSPPATLRDAPPPPADLLVFEEALPDPEQASEPAAAPRVVEFLVELGDRAGGGAAAMAAAGGQSRAVA